MLYIIYKLFQFSQAILQKSYETKTMFSDEKDFWKHTLFWQRIDENQFISLLYRRNHRLILESYDILLVIGCNHD